MLCCIYEKLYLSGAQVEIIRVYECIPNIQLYLIRQFIKNVIIIQRVTE